MEKFKNIIKSFDLLKESNGRIDVTKMTDEELDKLVDLQNDMVADALPALVAYTKMQAERRKKAEKEEEFAKVLIRRMMQRCEFTDFDCEDGKVKLTKGVKYDVDVDKLPKELFMPNHASIRASLGKGEQISGVVETDYYFISSVR